MPIVVTGFEPVDILEGVLLCVRQLEAGEARVENQYTRAVCREGNPHAKDLVSEVFEVGTRSWRGIGEIPVSGLRLREPYRSFDAEQRFDTDALETVEPPQCVSGRVLQGLVKPYECPAFGDPCTPRNPLGATMVSSEGACAAYYAYDRRRRSRSVATSEPG